MGYRCYIHPVDGSETDCGKDVCIGKLIGYVDDAHINELSVLPFIAFGLQYGQKHGADMDVDNMDVLGEWMSDDKSTLGSYMDIIDGQRILLPWDMLIPFLIAYYNDQQTYYITLNKQPLLKPGLQISIETVLTYFSDFNEKIINTAVWGTAKEYLIYWC